MVLRGKVYALSKGLHHSSGFPFSFSDRTFLFDVSQAASSSLRVLLSYIQV